MGYHNNYGSVRPKQKIPKKTKLSKGKKGEDFRIGSLEYYSSASSNYVLTSSEIERLYKVAAGYIDLSKYDHVLNPRKENKKRKYPYKPRNYDIISPILMSLLGEKIKKQAHPQVYAVNSNIESLRLEYKRKLVSDEIKQAAINEINKFVNTGIDTRDIMPQEQIDIKVGELKDEMALAGQEALNYILEHQDVFKKQRKMFYDYCVSTYAFSIKDIEFKDVVYDDVAPANTRYLASEKTAYIEDGEAASFDLEMTISEVLDKFHDSLKKEDYERLDNLLTDSAGNGITTSPDFELFENLRTNGIIENNPMYVSAGGSHMVTCTYTCWKSWVKIGKLMSTNMFGEIQEIFVSEDYQPEEGDEIEWKWVNEVWEGWIIDDDIYVDIRPIPFRRGTFENPSACKLPINGVTFGFRHYKSKSIVEKLEDYQQLYNIIHWQIEKVINKNKDKIIMLPWNMVPDNEDLDMFDMLYYADSTGYLFLNEVDERAMQNMQYIKVLDTSLNDYIRYLFDHLNSIKFEAEELVGFNRQRTGSDIRSSDGKATTQEAIYRGSLITEELFKQFEEFEEREYMGIVDLSKYAWKDGKKKHYIASDKTPRLLDIDGAKHIGTEYGIFCKNTSKDHEKLERIRQHAQAFAQNQTKASAIAKMEYLDNPAEIIDELEKMEEEMMQNSQAAQQAEQQAKMAETKQKEDELDQKLAYDYYKTDQDNLTKKEVALINSNSSILSSMSVDTNGVSAPNDRGGDELMKNNLQLEQIRLKRDEMNMKYKMNKENNETKLRNPVAGEK